MKLLTSVAVFGLLLAGSALAAVPTASAKIVEGQSVAGVKLGDSKAQVKQVLGKPSKTDPTDFFYPTSVGLRVHFKGGKVDGMLSFSKKQKTTKGITIGSSASKFKSAYPQAKCSVGPYGPNSLYCVVLAHDRGRSSYTGFLFESTGVGEIELGYGSGIG